MGSCVSHTEHPGGRSGRGSGTPILIAEAARLPPSVPGRVRWVVEPVYASTTPSLPHGACTRRRARPFTLACDASGISGPLFGVVGFATPVSLLPSVIPPHLRSLPSTDFTPLLRYSEPLRHPASPRPDPARSPVPCVHTPDRASRVAAVPPLPPMPSPLPRRNRRCSRRSLPDLCEPSPCNRRVGFRFAILEACSAFTLVTACVFAESPTRPFSIEVLQPRSLPPQTAPIAPGWNDSCRTGFAPAG